MFEIKNYRRATSLEEAWTLNQKKANRVIGGMMWLKMGRGSVDTAIDLSDLGLDRIEEYEKEFHIGCMVTLRQLELSAELNACFDNMLRDALCQIVGVQFRNLATVGGSVWGRYGFSDVLTVFTALGAELVLYRGGRMTLCDFLERKAERDILEKIILPKRAGHFAYLSVRNTKTDFPVLNVAAVLKDAKESADNDGRAAGLSLRLAVGARPQRAVLLTAGEGQFTASCLKQLSEDPKAAERFTAEAEAFSLYASEQIATGSNLRGSAAYRKRLVRVLTGRVLRKAAGLPLRKGGTE